jgi:uncharacterized protein YcbK (DUF882 family)
LERGARQANGKRRALLAGLFASLLAACSSTNEPSLELTAPTYSDAGSPAADLSAATESAATGQGDASPPEQVAGTPKVKPVVAVDDSKPTSEKVAEAATLPASSKAQQSSPKAEKEPTAVAGSGQFLENGGPILTAGTMPTAPIPTKKKSFLSSFFGSTPTQAAAADETPDKKKPLVAMAAKAEMPEQKPVRTASLGGEAGDFALPGVRTTNLFEIKRKSGLDDDSDIDVMEDVGGGSVFMASAAGMARLAPNGLLKQRESVDVACLKPALVRVLKTVERHYGKKMVVTSGYRSPTYNRKVNGAKKSQHMYCAAADVQVPGVSKWELAKYVRSMPGRGGVGTYCHTESVHIDIGPERDWNWNCRRRAG